MKALVDNLEEVFVLFGPIYARRMFGGHGVFHDGRMFGLVIDDVLYLKADGVSAPVFEKLGPGQFAYERSGKKVKMSYYMSPEEIFDDPVEAKVWASRAFEAALRSRKPVNRAKPTRRWRQEVF